MADTTQAIPTPTKQATSKTKITKRLREDPSSKPQKPEDEPTKRLKEKKRVPKPMNPLLATRSLPAWVTNVLSGTVKDRPEWQLPGAPMLKDNHKRVLTDTQVKLVTKAFTSAKDDILSTLPKSGVPSRKATLEARAIVSEALELTSPFVAPAFKMLTTDALSKTNLDDPACLMAFMGGAQRQISAAFCGQLEGAMAILARNLQVAPTTLGGDPREDVDSVDTVDEPEATLPAEPPAPQEEVVDGDATTEDSGSSSSEDEDEDATDDEEEDAPPSPSLFSQQY